jgi:Uma2 family endonuclease
LSTVVSPQDQLVVLHDISWETYERLLDDCLDSSGPRVTYDRGELEILGPSSEHEIVNRSLALLVELVAAELSNEVINVGSMTFKRQDLQQGFEPDSSFYIQNEERVRDRAQIDLTVDPPPDLVIEIEITRSAIGKLPLYAAMGVPEIWRWDGERVTIFRLEGSEYDKAPESAALASLTSEVLNRFMAPRAGPCGARCGSANSRNGHDPRRHLRDDVSSMRFVAIAIGVDRAS